MSVKPQPPGTLAIRFTRDAQVENAASVVVLRYKKGAVVGDISQASMLRWVRTGAAEFVDRPMARSRRGAA